MAKPTKPKPIKVKKPANPAAAAFRRRALLHTLGVILFCAALAGGIMGLKRYVDKRVVFASEPPKVVLLHRPVWMSDFLAAQIAAAVRPLGGHSALDHQMLVDITEMLRHDARIAPWIQKVNQVRRAYTHAPGDTLEIDCDYRVPIALVQWDDRYYLVDEQGILLPEQYDASQLSRILFGADGHTNIRIIDGVQCPKPLSAGQRWTGDDLAAGLQLVKLLYGLPYAEEIVKVDVANFQGRRDPRDAQLVLMTKYDTQVRWGRPVNAKDFFVEISTPEKLDHLRRVYEEYHRVDGHFAWIDLRFDKVTYPRPNPDAQATSR
jgi:hypothetical protein